eukprot:292701-Pelagomonas_calceolata.AAC.1
MTACAHVQDPCHGKHLTKITKIMVPTQNNHPLERPRGKDVGVPCIVVPPVLIVAGHGMLGIPAVLAQHSIIVPLSGGVIIALIPLICLSAYPHEQHSMISNTCPARLAPLFFYQVICVRAVPRQKAHSAPLYDLLCAGGHSTTPTDPSATAAGEPSARLKALAQLHGQDTASRCV